MATSLRTSIQPRFRTIDDLSIRYAESEDPAYPRQALVTGWWDGAHAAAGRRSGG